MPEPMSDKHYEEKFSFPFWTMIKQRAEEKDMSYIEAATEVRPEYIKTIMYRNVEFEKAAIEDRANELQRIEKERNK